MDPLKKQVDNATAALEIATARVVLLTAQAKADPSLKPQLVIALGQQADRQNELAALQKKLADNLKLTSDVQIVAWPLRSSESATATPFELPDDVFQSGRCPSPTVPRQRRSSRCTSRSIAATRSIPDGSRPRR